MDDKLIKAGRYFEDAFDIERLPFRRSMTHEEIQKLGNAVSLAFSSDVDKNLVEKIMHYCYYVERTIKGRAAGNIEDLIIRYFLNYFSSTVSINIDENLCHMEIGVLFGASTIYSCHAVGLAGKEIPIVAIDPLEGYYGNDTDIGTKLKVDEETFWSNIDRFNFRNRVRLNKGLSSDKEALERCKNLKILSLIIDGDHTYDGVKKDWINYSPLVVPGGYVLFDDYNSHTWKDVTSFVNNEALSNLGRKWEVVLVYGSSLILKRTNVKEDQESEQIDRLFHELKDKEMLINKQKGTIKGLKKDMNNKEEHIRNLQNSWSWRITSTLRWLKKKYYMLQQNE